MMYAFSHTSLDFIYIIHFYAAITIQGKGKAKEFTSHRPKLTRTSHEAETPPSVSSRIARRPQPDRRLNAVDDNGGLKSSE